MNKLNSRWLLVVQYVSASSNWISYQAFGAIEDVAETAARAVTFPLIQSISIRTNARDRVVDETCGAVPVYPNELKL